MNNVMTGTQMTMMDALLVASLSRAGHAQETPVSLFVETILLFQSSLVMMETKKIKTDVLLPA